MTNDALIEAAEQHFADEGFERASLRAVMREAGTDPGAIHYHFGDRATLAAAVLDRVLVPLNDRRLTLLEQFEREVDAPALVELVSALVLPDLEVAAELEIRGSGRSRLLGRIYLDPASFVTSQVEQRFRPVAERFLPALTAALPGIPADVIAWRVRWCLFGTLGALLADQGDPTARADPHAADHLVVTVAGALAAAAPKHRSTP